MIRLPNLYDAEELFLLVEKNRLRLREWLPWLDFTKTVEDTRSFIAESLMLHAKGSSFVNVILEDNQIVGIVDVRMISRLNNAVEIGYWIDSDASGKGILTCAVTELIELAFSAMKTHRIQIRAATGNVKSCAVATRLGMRLEGTIKEAEWLYDHYVDLNLYGITKPEWELPENKVKRTH